MKLVFLLTLFIHAVSCQNPDLSTDVKSLSGKEYGSNENLEQDPQAPTITYNNFAGSFGISVNILPATLNGHGNAITSCTATPTLPAWASLNNTSCRIMGTPNAISNQTYTITATNAIGSTSTSINIQITPNAPIVNYGSIDIPFIVAKNQTITPSTLDARGSAITNCTISPSLPNGLSINTSNCSLSGTPTSAHLKGNYTVTVYNNVGYSTASLNLFVCPQNYLAINANTNLGVDAFCVMQFEAKKNSVNENEETVDYPASVAAGTPWTDIKIGPAQTACSSLGEGYDLISNSEWMAIARNIENFPGNWSGNAVASGHVNTGHSDNSPASALAVTNTTDSWNNTGNTSQNGWQQKRTHSITHPLLGTQTIWDFAGNVWEWVNWTIGDTITKGPTNCTGNNWVEIRNITCNALANFPANYQYISSPGSNSHSTHGLGMLWPGDGGAALRGGSFGYTQSGIYTLALDFDENDAANYAGFRCVYRP
jgi:hypothetical protein